MFDIKKVLITIIFRAIYFDVNLPINRTTDNRCLLTSIFNRWQVRRTWSTPSVTVKPIMSSVPYLSQTSCRRICSLLYLYIDINVLYIAYYIGAELVRGRVCMGPSLWGPSLLGAEFVKGRDVQKPFQSFLTFVTFQYRGLHHLDLYCILEPLKRD